MSSRPEFRETVPNPLQERLTEGWTQNASFTESTITLHEKFRSNPLQRYMSRFLRREFFEKLAQHTFTAEDVEQHGRLVLDGSSVVQIHRPIGRVGFAFRRTARDVDPVIVTNDNDPRANLTSEQVTFFQKAFIDIAQSIGAEVVDWDDASFGNAIPIHFSKSYTEAEVDAAVDGKIEEDLVGTITALDVELQVSEMYKQTPLLPLIQYGDSGLSHYDLREVVGKKIARLICPLPHSHGGQVERMRLGKVRDLVDITNLLMSGRITIAEDAPILRAIAIARTGSEGVSTSGLTFDYVAPTRENIEFVADRLDVDEDAIPALILTKAQAALNLIFEQRSNKVLMPDRFKTPLNLTHEEFNFLSRLVGMRRKKPDDYQSQTASPSIATNWLSPLDAHPDLQSIHDRIVHDYALNKVVERSKER